MRETSSIAQHGASQITRESISESSMGGRAHSSRSATFQDLRSITRIVRQRTGFTCRSARDCLMKQLPRLGASSVRSFSTRMGTERHTCKHPKYATPSGQLLVLNSRDDARLHVILFPPVSHQLHSKAFKSWMAQNLYSILNHAISSTNRGV